MREEKSVTILSQGWRDQNQLPNSVNCHRSKQNFHTNENDSISTLRIKISEFCTCSIQFSNLRKWQSHTPMWLKEHRKRGCQILKSEACRGLHVCPLQWLQPHNTQLLAFKSIWHPMKQLFWSLQIKVAGYTGTPTPPPYHVSHNTLTIIALQNWRYIFLQRFLDTDKCWPPFCEDIHLVFHLETSAVAPKLDTWKTYSSMQKDCKF